MDFSQPDPSSQYQPIGPGSTSSAGSGTQISGQPCQLCGQGPASVQSYMWVMSFLVMTRHLEYSANLCRSCSTRNGLKEQAKSAILGWWGVPWGLLTFKALWVNARTLSRWSNLPAVAGLLTLLACLVVPTALGYWVYQETAEERQAKKTGDWIDEDAVALVEEGHEHYDAGRLEEAAASYRAAHEKAPRSSVVNASLAQTLIELGELEEALPYATTAAKRDPETPAWTAMHGWLLVQLEGPEAAQPQVAALRDALPGDAGDAIWMADFFDEVGEFDQLLRSARAGLVLAPGSLHLLGRELAALVELDRLEEAGAIVGDLDEQALEVPYLRYARDIYRMRTQTSAETERLCSRWIDTGYTTSGMAGFVRAAERAGKLDEVRSRIREWLHDPDTPSDAWGSAEAWFPGTWTAELDHYLEARPEPLPALLRLQLFDPLTEGPSIRRLASRVEPSDHPLSQYVDSFLYGAGSAGEPYARRAARIERHLDAFPDHVLCRSILAGLLVRAAPERATVQLDLLDEAARDDPALGVASSLDRAEVALALGRFDEALASLVDLEPKSAAPYAGADQIDLTTAEAAFHAGDLDILQKRLRHLIQEGSGGFHAAALLIRWSHELASGAPLTYRPDVDRLFARYGDSLLSERSTSAQAILIAEGRVEWSERRDLIPPDKHATLELVRIFRDAAETGTPDFDALERVAGSPEAMEYAPLLVRTALARHAGRSDA